jgi:hypothetical protein
MVMSKKKKKKKLVLMLIIMSKKKKQMMMMPAIPTYTSIFSVTGLCNPMMVLINKPRMYICLTFHSSICIYMK